MRKLLSIIALLSLIAVIPVLASSASSNSSGTLLESSIVGISTPSMTVRGIRGAGAPWVVAEGKAELERSGGLQVEVEGLLITGTGTAFDGTTAGVPGVRASLTCEGTVGAVATTGVAPFSSAGNAEIEEVITLPTSCVGPIVLVQIAGTGTAFDGLWIAATGF